MAKPLLCERCPNNLGSRKMIDLAPGEALVAVDDENNVVFAFNSVRQKWHRLNFKREFGRGFIGSSLAAEQHPDLVNNLENCENKETADTFSQDGPSVCPAFAQTLGSISAQNVINYFNANE